jgi:hypothetical protein
MVVTGLDVNGVLYQHSPLEAQLQATLNMVPAHAWYALPNGALTFVNERTVDYLGLPKDDPLRLGTGTGADSGPSGAAVKLGVSPSTLEDRIKALKVDELRYKYGWRRNFPLI